MTDMDIINANQKTKFISFIHAFRGLGGGYSECGVLLWMKEASDSDIRAVFLLVELNSNRGTTITNMHDCFVADVAAYFELPLAQCRFFEVLERDLILNGKPGSLSRPAEKAVDQIIWTFDVRDSSRVISKDIRYFGTGNFKVFMKAGFDVDFEDMALPSHFKRFPK